MLHHRRALPRVRSMKTSEQPWPSQAFTREKSSVQTKFAMATAIGSRNSWGGPRGPGAQQAVLGNNLPERFVAPERLIERGELPQVRRRELPALVGVDETAKPR